MRLQSFRPNCEAMEDRIVPSTVLPDYRSAAPAILAEKFVSAPSFTATTVSPTQINLSWANVSGATKYLIEELVKGRWRQIAVLNNKCTARAIIHLTPNTTSTFDVVVVKGHTQIPMTLKSTRTMVVPIIPPAPWVDHPTAVGTYTAVQGTLFGPNGPAYTDVQQGDEGDCWLMASFAEVAARDPQDIRNMFTYVGTYMENGSQVQLYDVYFYTNAGHRKDVVVDTELPLGGEQYAYPVNGVLWVALAEKAYVEANAMGYVTCSDSSQVNNCYDVLNGGDAAWALQAITGHAAATFSIYPNGLIEDLCFDPNELVVLGSSNQTNSLIVPGHDYAVVNINPASATPFQLYNPWGTLPDGFFPGLYNGHQVYGLFTCDAAFLSQQFVIQSVQ